MKKFGCLFSILGPCALLVGLTTSGAVGWTVAGVIMIILGIYGIIATLLS